MNSGRIAFVIDGLQMGGAEKFLIALVNKIILNGYEPIVILLSDKTSLLHEINKDIKVYTFLRLSRFDLTVSFRIKELIKTKGIRKIFCINPYAFFLTKLAFLFDRKVKFYLSLHSTNPESVNVYLKTFIYFRVVSERDHLIFVCNNQRDYLQKKYFLALAHKVVIHNGINTSFFNPEQSRKGGAENTAGIFNYTKQGKVILNVARIYPEKGHLDAVKALSILHKEFGYKAHLLFVGGGSPDYLLDLKNYIHKVGLENYIHFAGNQEDVREFYSQSDIFTLTSFSETFSLSALEAMAYGLPCSLTDVGGANEMVIEGISGTLCKPKNPYSIARSWLKLLSTPVNKEAIRDYVKINFSSDRMLQEYMKIFTAT